MVRIAQRPRIPERHHQSQAPNTAAMMANDQIARCGVRLFECSIPKCAGTSLSFPIA